MGISGDIVELCEKVIFTGNKYGYTKETTDKVLEKQCELAGFLGSLGGKKKYRKDAIMQLCDEENLIPLFEETAFQLGQVKHKGLINTREVPKWNKKRRG